MTQNESSATAWWRDDWGVTAQGGELTRETLMATIEKISDRAPRFPLRAGRTPAFACCEPRCVLAGPCDGVTDEVLEQLSAEHHYAGLTVARDGPYLAFTCPEGRFAFELVDHLENAKLWRWERREVPR